MLQRNLDLRGTASSPICGQGNAQDFPALVWRFSWRAHQFQDRHYPPRRVREVLHFLGVQIPAQDLLFPVRKPLLEDLVAAQPVVPNVCGDVAPVGPVVQVDVESRVAQGVYRIAQSGALVGGVEAFHDPSLARHDSVAGAEVSPACGHREIVAGHVAPVIGRRNADGSEFGA